MSYDVTPTQGYPEHWAYLQNVNALPLLLLSLLPKKKCDPVGQFLSLLTSIALEFCPLQVSGDCLNGVRLLMLTIMIMDVTSCHLELARTGTKQPALWECHEPASFPVSACGLCSLLWIVKSCTLGAAPLPAAFTLSGPFYHGYFKAAGKCL